jgi:FixJ family two-component response regulator
MKNIQIPIFVVDDDEALRRSMLMLLYSQHFSVQCFDSGELFLNSIHPRQAGVVILDLRMTGINGLKVLEQLQQWKCPLVTIFLSGHGDIPTALEAVRLGAFDWVVKPDTEQLLAKLPCAVQEARERAAAYELWRALTPREREVAHFVGLGKTNKEIARLLVPTCGPRSVETHRANLFYKLQVANDNELGRWLGRFSWLPSP